MWEGFPTREPFPYAVERRRLMRSDADSTERAPGGCGKCALTIWAKCFDVLTRSCD